MDTHSGCRLSESLVLDHDSSDLVVVLDSTVLLKSIKDGLDSLSQLTLSIIPADYFMKEVVI